MPELALTKENPVTEDELTGEFVSGGANFFSSRRLSFESTDRVHPNLTAKGRKLLRYDSEVESSVEFLIDAVFAEGIQPVPSVTDTEAEEYDEAQEIAKFIGKAVISNSRKLEAVMREIFRDAFYNGVKAAEIVLKVDPNGNLVMDRLNPKPNSTISFVCDRFYNVLGLASWTYFVAAEDVYGKRKEIIAREKFVILQFELADNDPRGVKKINAVIDDYNDKQCTRKEYREWRRTSAIPKKVGIAPQSAKQIPVHNPDGTPKIVDGVPQTISMEKALMNALEGFANNSAITAPFGTDIKQLEVTGTGDQFIKSLKSSNTGIRKGILGDSLATGEADKDARAAKEVAMNVVDLRVKHMKNIVAECVERDLFKLLTVVNFGKEKAHLSPLCSLGDTERRDWATDLKAATSAGYKFAPEHFPVIDVQFGQKPRKELPDEQQIADNQAANKIAPDKKDE